LVPHWAFLSVSDTIPQTKFFFLNPLTCKKKSGPEVLGGGLPATFQFLRDYIIKKKKKALTSAPKGVKNMISLYILCRKTAGSEGEGKDVDGKVKGANDRKGGG
jgi:hypothetical protein